MKYRVVKERNRFFVEKLAQKVYRGNKKGDFEWVKIDNLGMLCYSGRLHGIALGRPVPMPVMFETFEEADKFTLDLMSKNHAKQVIKEYQT